MMTLARITSSLSATIIYDLYLRYATYWTLDDRKLVTLKKNYDELCL